MNKLIHDEIKLAVRLMGYDVDKKQLFGNLQGYINGFFDCGKLRYSDYKRYLRYINFKFI